MLAAVAGAAGDGAGGAGRSTTGSSNGRFKGGYITRHYGQPERGIDAVQLETSQRNYMDEDSFEYDEAKAAQLQQVISSLLQAALEVARRAA